MGAGGRGSGVGPRPQKGVAIGLRVPGYVTEGDGRCPRTSAEKWSRGEEEEKHVELKGITFLSLKKS